MTAAEIAEVLRMALSTVSAVLRRIGLGKRSRLATGAAQPLRAHAPGELVHLDIKKLDRRRGRARVTGQPRQPGAPRGTRRRLGVRPRLRRRRDAPRLRRGAADERGHRGRFLRRAVAWFASAASRRAVMSDNGACYRSDVHALACRARHPPPPRTRPTARAPTARPSASSRRCRAGPTAHLRRQPAERTAACGAC